MKIQELKQNLNIPYDTAPFEVLLAPYEIGRIHGWIEVQNGSREEMLLKIRFDLRQGYILTVTDREGVVVIEQHVGMNSNYHLQAHDGIWSLNKKFLDSILEQW